MVPYSERRHRLNPVEIEPVKAACYNRLFHLLEERDPGYLLKASALFRVWYRIHTYCTSKPAYPDHGTWGEISAYMDFGTVARARAGDEETT